MLKLQVAIQGMEYGASLLAGIFVSPRISQYPQLCSSGSRELQPWGFLDLFRSHGYDIKVLLEKTSLTRYKNKTLKVLARIENFKISRSSKQKCKENIVRCSELCTQFFTVYEYLPRLICTVSL